MQAVKIVGCPTKKRPEIASGLLFIYYKKHFMSAATFKSAIGHVRTVTAVCSDSTTEGVHDMIAARFCCRLIAFFLFIFFVHVSPHHYTASFSCRAT
jgi:hypothetical protein